MGGAGSQVPFSTHVKLTATESQYVGNPELALSFLKEIYLAWSASSTLDDDDNSGGAVPTLQVLYSAYAARERRGSTTNFIASFNQCCHQVR